MIDYFGLLDEPRGPWLDAELLKAKFLALSAGVHPDRVHEASEAERAAASQRFAELNAAYHCLRDPKRRLLHLLELELGSRPREVQPIGDDSMELFVQAGQLCHGADKFLAERAKVSSPLLKVRMFEQAQEWIEKLNAARRTIATRFEKLTSSLPGMNADWANASGLEGNARPGALPLDRVEEIYRELSYLGRWTQQIEERLVLLSL